jgi:tRNA G10  N-methylase Trm11
MPTSSICILGRQPELGLAELESVFGADTVRPVGSVAALVDAQVDLKQFGGQMKTARFITEIPTTDFNKLFDHVRRNLHHHIANLPDGKIKFGLSFYDFNIPPAKINASALGLKKVIKSAGRSVRIVPNTESALSTAQTMHNQLTSPVGIELVFVRDGNKTLLGQVVAVQDIDDYTLRDRGRPKRDAFVGMLPPKLAQVMINLAPTDGRVLDPFCGTGVVLQEAALRGNAVYGTDLAEKMIDYSRANLDWLSQKYNLEIDAILDVGDATDHTWKQPIGAVVCEGYLGQPMSHEPDREKLESVMHTCNVIMRKFLKNIAGQLEPGTRLCVGAPTWFVRGSFHHLAVTEKLKELGYDRVTFQYISSDNLIYHRSDQIVGRELIVLVKN